MDIVLTVSYSLTIPEDAYFQPGTSIPSEAVRQQLEQQFPAAVVLGGVTARRDHLTTLPLREGCRFRRCAGCGRWLYLPGAEETPALLDPCRMVKGIPLCPGCAWELERDLQDEAFAQTLREGQAPKQG